MDRLVWLSSFKISLKGIAPGTGPRWQRSRTWCSPSPTNTFEKVRKELGWDLCPCERGKLPHLRSPLPGGKTSQERRETSEPLKRAELVYGEHSGRETCTDGRYHCPALPSLRCSSAGMGGDWQLRPEVLEVRP